MSVKGDAGSLSDGEREALSWLASLGEDEREAVGEYAAARAEGMVSRRDALALAGGALVGGAAGGGLVGSAAADASTSDSDGDVGLPGDRVDVFADGVSANSVTTDVENDEVYNIDTSDDPQAIHDNDAAAGDVLHFLPGTHSLSLSVTGDGYSAGLDVTKDDITVRIPSGATVQVADSQNPSAGDALLNASAGTSGVNFKGGGTVGGNSANNSGGVILLKGNDNASDIEVKDLEFDDLSNSGRAIDMAGHSGNRISTVRIIGVYAHDVAEGIQWRYTDDLRLSDFEIETVTVADGIEPANESDDWKIENGIIDDTQQSGIDIFDGASNGTISNVTFRNNGASGNNGGSINYSTTSSLPIQDVLITGCVIRNPTNSAIASYSGSGHEGIHVRDTLISGSGSNGIALQNGSKMSAIGCEVHNCGFRGIDCTAPQSDVKDNTCYNNDQDGGATPGIDLDADRITCENNTCYDDQGTGTQDAGVRLRSNATEAFVQGNHAWGNTTTDIQTANAPVSAVVQNNKTG